MKSWEVLRDAIDKVGVKVLAAKLNLSSALVYKWCQESPQDDPGSSGALNPLDRLKSIYDVTGDDRVINYVCIAAKGFFVRNPKVDPGTSEAKLLSTTQRMVNDFGELLNEVSKSSQNDGQISTEEADNIRQAWEKLKAMAECFVVACERGMYRKKT